MTSNTVMMKLPAARAWQIKNLATSRGTTATEAVEFLLNRAIEDGLLPDALPTFEVERDEEHFIHLKADGHQLPKMNADMAGSVAKDLEDAATVMGVGRGRPRWFGRDGYGSNTDIKLVVARIGTGVIIGLDEERPLPGQDRPKPIRASMTRGMAADLARQLRAAIGTH